MTLKLPAIFVLVLLPGLASAFDTAKASTARFKVAYVEPKEMPPITALPLAYQGRDQAIANEKITAKLDGEKGALKMRRLLFEDALFPIRITDQETGIIYQVQEDRRTITATKPDGSLIWKVKPSNETDFAPARKHPIYICMFCPSNKGRRPLLSFMFTSGDFWRLDTETGGVTPGGRD